MYLVAPSSEVYLTRELAIVRAEAANNFVETDKGEVKRGTDLVIMQPSP